jgi:hypothetical protein
VPVVPPVPVVVVHTPFVHVPLHAWLQPPQLAWLVSVSTHELPHSIWPAVAQPHVPLTHAVAPLAQALQPPQWAVVLSPPFATQVLPHMSGLSLGQLDAQVEPLHTCPDGQTLVQLPQWVASLETHWPLQLRRPEPQPQVPFAQTWPVPHAWPQAPQFWLSVATVLHWPLQSIWPVLQVTPPPLVGLAQLAANRRQANEAVRRAERDRVFIDEPRR